MMKKHKTRIAGALAGTVLSIHAVADTNIDLVNQNMLDACPAVWEDIKSEIDPSAITGDIWNGDTTDKETFKSFLATAMGGSAPTASELETMASDPSTVAGECATQRIALLDTLLSRVPSDALLAMNSVLDQLGVATDAIQGGGWRIGDVRITGRSEPDAGWFFLSGQTIGSPSSDAIYTGDVLASLFEIAKLWPPNSGDEVWGNGDVVTLPVNSTPPGSGLNMELKFGSGTDGDLAFNPLPPGSDQQFASASCRAIKEADPSSADGVYWIDVNAGDSVDAFQAYCDMTSEGGGWMLVVAQYEDDPVTDWDEGIQPDYDPTLGTTNGFALSAAQLPQHMETAFGKDLEATYVDYADFVYTTGNIDTETLDGKKTGKVYHIHRNDSGVKNKCEPQEGGLKTNSVNRLTFDEANTHYSYNWCYDSGETEVLQRGRGMLGNLDATSEAFAWTVWVR